MTTPYQEEEGEDGELKKEIGVISMVAIGRENHEIQSCYNQSCQDSSGIHTWFQFQRNFFTDNVLRRATILTIL